MNFFTRFANLLKTTRTSEPIVVETSEPAELSYFDMMTEAQWLQAEINLYEDAATLEIIEEARAITSDFILANQATFEIETAYADVLETPNTLAESIAFAEDCLAMVERARAAAFAMFAETKLEMAVAADGAYFGNNDFSWSE